MGMSTHVVGFKPADDKWRDMKVIWQACDKQNIAVPEDVYKFFEGEPPDESGVKVDLDPCVKAYELGTEERYEIDVTKLPKDVTIIRFYNLW